MYEPSDPSSSFGDWLYWESDNERARWVPIPIAEKRIAAWGVAESARSKLIEYLMNGVVQAGADKAFIRAKPMKIFGKSASIEQVESDFNNFSGNARLERILSGPGTISPKFWEKIHASSNGKWETEEGFLWPTAVFSDWERGEFGVFTGEVFEPSEDDEFFGGIVRLYGVQILEIDIDAVAPERSITSRSPDGRTTKFDWEAAFADVAAWLFSDADIPDVNAKGVQSMIIDRLRQSFLERGMGQPEDTSLKNKARIIMGALRAK